MAKGTPNDSSMQLNFVAKVWDETAGDYRPIYIAPDATDKVRGDVYLSDAINNSDNAATGVTAATPKAVKDTYDAAIKNNITTAQKMQSDLTPTANNTLSLGTSALKWANIYATTIHGALNGNASSASALQTPRTITVQNAEYAAGAGSASFDGQSNVTIKINGLDASSLKTGTVPMERLPQGALERLIHVPDQAARFKLTTDTVQLGDTVQQDDTGIMYIVVNESKLSNADGYTEYTAGTAAQAQRLNPGATIQTALGSDSAETFTGESDITPGVTGILPIKHGGTGTADGIPTVENPGLVPELPNENAINQFLNGLGQWAEIKNNIIDFPKGDWVELEDGIYRCTGYWSEYTDNSSAKIDKGHLIIKWSRSPGNIIDQEAYILVINNGLDIDLYEKFNFCVYYYTNDNKWERRWIDHRPLSVMHGGTGTNNGIATTDKQGLVPKLPAGDDVEQMFLNGNNEWKKVVTEIADGSITTEKLADAAVDLTKLGIDIETVYIGNKQPTDDNIRLWINPDKESDKELTGIIQSISEEVIKRLYPVGTIIRSKSAISPSQIYGGTWELSPYHDFQGVYIYTKISDAEEDESDI